MSWNGSGTFLRIYSWVADKAAGLDIIASRMDTDTNDIASNGFGNCLTRDGQGGPTANLPMNNLRHTGVANGVARTDYAALGQVQDSLTQWTTAGGSADAITATYTPALTALADGQLCFVRAASANATTTPTFAPNGLTAHTILKVNGSALQAGDIAGNLHELILRYNLSSTAWELLNPGATLAQGTTATRPGSPTDGVIRYNQSLHLLEYFSTAANAWINPGLLPNVQQFISGTSQTYTPTAGIARIRVRMVGGGGGGGGGGGTGNGPGGSGAASTFGSWAASGGAGGANNSAGAGGQGGGGGSAGASGTGLLVLRMPGGGGGSGSGSNANYNLGLGGSGGANLFGGAGQPGQAVVGNSGGGGAGGANGSGGAQAQGGGGGAGEYVEFMVTAPTATTYTVGTAGTAGAAGTGSAGNAGAAGRVVIEEYYW